MANVTSKDRPRQKRAKRPLTLAEYQSLTDAIRRMAGIAMNRNLALVSMQVHTSLRAGDVLALSVGQVTTSDGKPRRYLRVMQRKTEEIVQLALPPACRNDLARWLVDYKAVAAEPVKPDWPLWPGHLRLGGGFGWKGIGYTGYRDLLYQWCFTANLPLDELGTHSLRSALPGRLYATTGDLLAAQELFGHTSPLTTARYLAGIAKQKAREARDDYQFSGRSRRAGSRPTAEKETSEPPKTISGPELRRFRQSDREPVAVAPRGANQVRAARAAQLPGDSTAEPPWATWRARRGRVAADQGQAQVVNAVGWAPGRAASHSGLSQATGKQRAEAPAAEHPAPEAPSLPAKGKRLRTQGAGTPGPKLKAWPVKGAVQAAVYAPPLMRARPAGSLPAMWCPDHRPTGGDVLWPLRAFDAQWPGVIPVPAQCEEPGCEALAVAVLPGRALLDAAD